MKKYEEIDQIIQQELRDYNPDSSNLELFKVDAVKIKRLTLKTFPDIESDWNNKVGTDIEAYVRDFIFKTLLFIVVIQLD